MLHLRSEHRNTLDNIIIQDEACIGLKKDTQYDTDLIVEMETIIKSRERIRRKKVDFFDSEDKDEVYAGNQSHIFFG